MAAVCEAPQVLCAAYDDDLQPTQVVKTSSGTTRTTASSYDALGRALTSTVAVTGAGADSDTRTSSTGYDPASGLPTTVSNSDGTITAAYDNWGRVKTYTDATGMTSAPTYTIDGRVAGLNDGSGTYAYGYDGPAGEHRRLRTSVDAGFGTGLPDVFTLGYDAHGNQSRVTYPNGMVATYTRDDLGVPTGLDYADPATGTTLLSFTNTVDVDGRVLDATSTASAQDYAYDNLGRLTRTQDTRDGACTTRTYGFSAASERTSYASYAAATDRTCQQTTAAVSKTNTYDTANRIRNTGYSYDTLGRTLTLPAIDTAAGGLSDLATTYYANDMVKSMTQTVDDGTGGNLVKSTNYTLDPTGRINHIVNMSSGTETNRLRYRFSDGSDSPTSIQTSTDGGASWTGTTRYLTLPRLGMVASVEGGTATIQLANLHGDVVASQQETSGPLVIDSYGETDEYGNAATPATVIARYGYLGSHQRSSDTVGGIALMGARAYDPATGLFLSSDPILNGGANRYSYPTDPVNNMDLTGAWWGCGQTCRGWIWGAAMSALSTIVGGACAATTGLYLACDILGGAIVGVIDYSGDHLFVQQNSVSGTDAFNAAVNGAPYRRSADLFSVRHLVSA